jgi:ribosomal protein S18 acetylase RimI-like enzyme
VVGLAAPAGSHVSDVEIVRGGVDRIDDLRTLFLALHDHHRGVSAMPLTEPDDRAWAERVATYTGHFRDGHAVLHLALQADRLVGYAFTVLHDGTDDTFELAPRYAELYTLAVAPDVRGGGIGTALLDAVDATLDELGIRSLTVAVMTDNEAAIRLYRRRGLVPAELILMRIEPKER